MGLFTRCNFVSALMSDTHSMHILHIDQCHLMCHTLKCTWSVGVIHFKNGTGKVFDVTEVFLCHDIEVKYTVQNAVSTWHVWDMQIHTIHLKESSFVLRPPLLLNILPW